jgi:SAM-dependent methyltransferase
MSGVETAIADLEREYPPSIRPLLANNRMRFAFEASEMLAATNGSGKLLDVGSGLSPFPILCAMAGMEVTAVDDFRDPSHSGEGLEVLKIHEKYGVSVLSGDIFSMKLPFDAEELSAISSFDSMEHWHQSPKRLFHQLLGLLRPGGSFFLGGPNCVNLRKRLTVPLGHGKWTGMDAWYEAPEFRSHVREPDVDDLLYIARDLGLENVRIYGRNWVGYRSNQPFVRAVVPFVDRLLQLRPSLCGDIYMMGRKPR